VRKLFVAMLYYAGRMFLHNTLDANILWRARARGKGVGCDLAGRRENLIRGFFSMRAYPERPSSLPDCTISCHSSFACSSAYCQHTLRIELYYTNIFPGNNEN
jgi:hypothetical protein